MNSRAASGSSGKSRSESVGRITSPILRHAIADAIKGVLYRALSAAQGDVRLAAKNIGTSKTFFYTLMKRYGIKLERQVRVRMPGT
jgi:transcriptional regulator of acetoin/glycerol metabolism